MQSISLRVAYQEPSKVTYLGVRRESRRLGIRPWCKVEANAKMCFFAASKLPVVRNRPRSEMKTSRPQHLAQPVVKCGNPAAGDGVTFAGSRDADRTCPCICTEQRARSCMKLWPDDTNSDICSKTARWDALYASETTMAKYFGCKNGGTLALIRSKRFLNHSAGFERLGSVSACLREEVISLWSK
jgi:hypothetical protein